MIIRENCFFPSLLSGLHVSVYKTEVKLFLFVYFITRRCIKLFFRLFIRPVSSFLPPRLNQLVNLASDLSVPVPKQNGEKLKILQLPEPAQAPGGHKLCLMYPRKGQPSAPLTNQMGNLQWEVRGCLSAGRVAPANLVVPVLCHAHLHHQGWQLLDCCMINLRSAAIAPLKNMGIHSYTSFASQR